MPYFYVTGNVNEKLQSAISNEIIPKLTEDIPCKYTVEQLAADKELPRFGYVAFYCITLINSFVMKRHLTSKELSRINTYILS